MKQLANVRLKCFPNILQISEINICHISESDIGKHLEIITKHCRHTIWSLYVHFSPICQMIGIWCCAKSCICHDLNKTYRLMAICSCVKQNVMNGINAICRIIILNEVQLQLQFDLRRKALYRWLSYYYMDMWSYLHIIKFNKIKMACWCLTIDIEPC